MNSDRRVTAKSRVTITALVAVLAAIISGIVFRYKRMNYPHMHIILSLVVGFSILLLIFLAIWSLGAFEKRARLAKVLRRCYVVCIAVGLAGFLLLQGLIISGARSDDEEADCMIILGAGLMGEYPSVILSTRLNAAVEYIRARGDMPVIVSGGMGE
jgi:FlaA1/EpsC-like NDP-sugar epimerase